MAWGCESVQPVKYIQKQIANVWYREKGEEKEKERGSESERKRKKKRKKKKGEQNEKER